MGGLNAFFENHRIVGAPSGAIRRCQAERDRAQGRSYKIADRAQGRSNSISLPHINNLDAILFKVIVKVIDFWHVVALCTERFEQVFHVVG